MPYITKDRKDDLDLHLDDPRTAGELNFQLTRTIQAYLGEVYNYQHINDVLGALEGAKLEFYRRVAVPYEDKKIIENGDVYPYAY